MFIEEEFSIKLPPYDVNLETFATFNQIVAVVQQAVAAPS
jgi:acyl carrier protein